MKLKYPNSDVDFDVTPAYFLGDFDIYDREEELGVKLNAFDPNEEGALLLLMDKFFFRGGRVASLQPEHKAELLRVLSAALDDKNFDFRALVSPGEHLKCYFTLPDSWKIRDPRELFGRIYMLAASRWGSGGEGVA
jgi:hypothetical protein